MSLVSRVQAAVNAFRSPGAPSRRASSWGITPNYEAASQGRRTADWNPGNESVNAALYSNSDLLRARSRDMVRKNAWANNGSEVFVSEAIGTGLKPQSQHTDPTIKADLQKKWTAWTDYSDAAGTQDFYGLQALAVRSMMEGGECFCRIRYRRPEDNLLVPMQLQLLEAEHCPTWLNLPLPSGNTIRNGIEFNGIGQREAYWLYQTHPGERSLAQLSDTLLPVRIPAKQVLHLFRPIRPGQLRGEPWLSRALVRLYDYDQYTDAELMRKKVAAMFAGFIVENDPVDPLPGGPGGNSLPGEDGYSVAPQGLSFSGMEPGTLQKLNPGEDIKFSAPADVGAGFREFNTACLREIAVAIGVPYESLTGDLTSVNYSSIRAGLLNFRRKMEQIQHSVIVFQFCRPVWRLWLDAAALAEEISVSDYRKNAAQYLDVKWIAPGWQWVDPEKEVNAAKAAVRNGFKSATQIISEQGYDIEDTYNEIFTENKLADKLGLVRDIDPRATADSGMRPGGKDPINPNGLQTSAADTEQSATPDQQQTAEPTQQQ